MFNYGNMANQAYNFNSSQISSLLAVESEVKKNPTIELGLDTNYNQITQALDYGQMYYYDRTPILNEKSFADIEKIVLTDPQVIASLDRKRLAVLQLGWSIKPANEDPKAIELKEFIEYNLKSMTGTIEDALFQLYSSIVFGYSLSEINFRYCNSDKFKNKLVLKDIKNKNTGVYQFNLDPFGNVLAITNLYNLNQPLPKDKFIWVSWKPRYSNPYGYGLADTLYYLCYAKKQLFKNSLIGSGKWANPSLYIELPENPSDAEIDAAKMFAYEIQNSSAGVLPAPLKAQLLEIANRSQNPNLEIMSFINDEIAKCINLSSAGTTSNEGKSSYASKQIELTSSLIDENYMIGLSEDIINEKLIKLLCGVNYNVKAYPQELYPSFVFNPILSEEKSGLIDRLDKLNSMGFLDATSENDREFVRNIDGLPKESELIDNESDFIKNTGSTRPNNVLLDDVTSAKTDLLMDQVKAVSYSEYTDE